MNEWQASVSFSAGWKTSKLHCICMYVSVYSIHISKVHAMQSCVSERFFVPASICGFGFYNGWLVHTQTIERKARRAWHDMT